MDFPNELDLETYLIEYIPGTYGDFVCAIISYSIDGFFDPCDPYWTDSEKYWKFNDDSTMIRNKYPLSLRGGGYEYVEKYTEQMLSHKFFLDYPRFLNVEHDYKKIMFNTHPKLGSNMKEEDVRTLYNNLTKTKTKILTTELNFDNILRVACNEYFTSSNTGVKNLDWDNLFRKFSNTTNRLFWFSNNVSTNKLLNIDNILEFTPDHISYYGKVNNEKFCDYYNEYKEKKLDHLDVFSKAVQRDIFKDSYRKNLFMKEFDNAARTNT